ncbi:MAG TPA: aminopeptidase N [Actinomycetota bacterium]|nr:aminopeptidase N [Actinomycetota bacterium]
MKSSNLTREEAGRRAALISDVRYDVTLDLDAGPERFGVDAEIRFRGTEPGASTFMEFLAPDVATLELNGEALDPAKHFDGVRIALPAIAAENRLHVVGSGSYQRDGIGLHRAVDPVDGEAYVYSDAEPYDIHRVYPCFDQPDLKATFTFTVKAPAGWQVASNTAPSERPPEGAAGTWRFPPTPLMSTYITCIAAGPFHVVRDRHGDIDLGIWVRKTLAPFLDADEIFEVTKQGFDFFADAFDYPYPFGKYDQLFVPEFNSGAMENIACVTFNEDYIYRSKVTDAARERRAETILHEMAHMWFGDLVTMRWWDDLWLNESFASWAAIYAQAKATRWTNAWVTFADAEKTWAYRQDQLASTHPIVADIPDIASTKVNFDGITYAKGASVLKQLVAWVGEEDFLKGLRTYFRRHEYANTELSDFLTALEESSGRDLHAWAKEWLQTAGVNTLRPRLASSADRLSSVEVIQEAIEEHPTLRPHRIAIGLYDADGESFARRIRVELDVVGARTEVPEIAGEALPDLLLLNDDDLTFAKVRLDARSFDTLVGGLRRIGDPLPRALCWGAAWDMTRDAEIAARSYLDLVLGNVGGETEIGVVQSLLGQAASAINLYGRPDNRVPALHRLASAALEGAEGSPAGSDHQLVWARCFIAAAQSAEHHAFVRKLLDGASAIEGLAVDTDLRWLIVRSLAAAGLADAALIDSELGRDPSDKGRREAAAARSLRPTPEAKEEAWTAIVEDAELPYSVMRAMMAGFSHPAQTAVLEPYRSRYFDVVGSFWSERATEIAIGFTSWVYPRVLIEQRTVDETDRFLAEAAPIAPCRRLVSEGRDDVVRALRARERDAQI